LSVSLLTNLVVTLETNQVLTYVTNLIVSQVTNVLTVPTNLLVHDYYLYTEILPPPDFTLASGESLVLLVDGVRWGFSPGQLGTVFVGRKGYTTTHYKVPPEVLVDIANAQQVRLRIRGVNSVIERKLSGASRNHFRQFLLRYFSPETGQGKMAGASVRDAGPEAGASLTALPPGWRTGPAPGSANER
jgi:hypothetical protein